MDNKPVPAEDSMLQRRFLALHDQISNLEQAIASEHETVSVILAYAKMIAAQLSIPVPLVADPLPPRSNDVRARDAVSSKREMVCATVAILHDAVAANGGGEPPPQPWKRTLEKAIAHIEDALSAECRRVPMHHTHDESDKCVPIRRIRPLHVASRKRAASSGEVSATPQAATLSSSPTGIALHGIAPMTVPKRVAIGGSNGIPSATRRSMQGRAKPKAARCLSPSSPSSSSSSSSYPQWHISKRARLDPQMPDSSLPIHHVEAKHVNNETPSGEFSVDTHASALDARATPHTTLRAEKTTEKRWGADENSAASLAVGHRDLCDFASALERPSSSKCRPRFVATPSTSSHRPHSKPSTHNLRGTEAIDSAPSTQGLPEVVARNRVPNPQGLPKVSASNGAPNTQGLPKVSASNRVLNPRALFKVAASNAAPNSQGLSEAPAINGVPNTHGLSEAAAINGVPNTKIFSGTARRKLPEYRPRMNNERFELFRAFHQYTCAEWAHRFMNNMDEPHTCDANQAKPLERNMNCPERQRLALPEALKALATRTSAAGLKKRCQPHWMLDRSSLVFVTGIMQKYAKKRDIRGLLRNLFFAIVAMCKAENWELFGEVDECRDMMDMAEKLSKRKITKKPYDTNRSLALFAKKYDAPEIASLRQKYSLSVSYDGVLCFMHNLGAQMDQFVNACFVNPTPEKTERLLNELRVPSFAKLVLQRYLGFLSPKCSGPNQRLLVGSGALPTLEWIYGGQWEWTTYKHSTYSTKISKKLRKELLSDLYRRMTQTAQELPACLPSWLPMDAQVIEHQLCELRKFATAGTLGGTTYRARCNSCYRTLLTAGEDFSQHRAEYLDGMLAQARTAEDAARGAPEDADGQSQCSDVSSVYAI